MDRYIIINGFGENVRVPILATKDNGYILRIGKGRENQISLSPSAERYLIYHLYWSGATGFSSYLHNYKRGGFTPIEIDKAIEVFKRDHPTTEVGGCNFEDVPLYADDEGGSIELITSGGICILPAEYEKKFMQLLIDKPYCETFVGLKGQVFQFRCKYSLDYSVKYIDQDEEIAKEFLHQHGIRRLDDLPPNPVIAAAKGQREQKKAKKHSRKIVIFGVVFMALYCLVMQDNIEFPWDIITAAAFFGMLGMIFNKLFPNVRK